MVQFRRPGRKYRKAWYLRLTSPFDLLQFTYDGNSRCKKGG
jgi:hypothetical protein